MRRGADSSGSCSSTTALNDYMLGTGVFEHASAMPAPINDRPWNTAETAAKHSAIAEVITIAGNKSGESNAANNSLPKLGSAIIPQGSA